MDRAKIKVSIVIPVYNVEKYIESCLISVVEQSYQNLECLLIDDCSPDNSMKIVEIFIRNYKGKISFKIIAHEKNKGLSAARNTGIGSAIGEYIYFLDSDDELPSNAIESLIGSILNYSADFVTANYILNNNASIKEYIKMTSGFYEGNLAIIKSYLKGNWNVMGCNKLVNLQFLRNNKLFFHEGLLHEDELWSFMLACTATSMYVCPDFTYLYNMREGSITHFDIAQRLPHLIRIMDLMKIFLNEHQLPHEDYAHLIIEKFQKELFLKAVIQKTSISAQKQIYACIRTNFYFNHIQPLKTIIYGSNRIMPYHWGFYYYRTLLLLSNRRRIQ